jgi:hypothetical protein
VHVRLVHQVPQILYPGSSRQETVGRTFEKRDAGCRLDRTHRHLEDAAQQQVAIGGLELGG